MESHRVTVAAALPRAERNSSSGRVGTTDVRRESMNGLALSA